MDKSWMSIRNRISSKVYKTGVKAFIDFAIAQLGPVDKIRCPCVDCLNRNTLSLELVKFHLIQRGISTTYKTWLYHGETVSVPQPHISHEGNQHNDRTDSHRMGGDDPGNGDEFPTMLEDVYKGVFMDDDIEDFTESWDLDDVRRFDKLLDDAQRPLYPGCTCTVLSFVIKILHCKVYNKWTNTSFNMIMNVFKDVLPKCDEIVPWNLYEAKKFLRDLGLGYVPIHACKYDCALFWKENANLENCPR